MSDEEVKMHFDIFLIENGAYEAFYRNRGGRPVTAAYKSDIIIFAFGWGDTPEGNIYWSKLNQKWEKTYAKLL